jgi:DNA-binding beta-propeller fold protein YncE
MRAIAICLCLLSAPATALDLKLSGFYDLNRPASLEYDPDFCGLWVANEGREVILVTLDGIELRRFSSGLSRIKAVTIEDRNILVADGYGAYQRLTKDGTELGAPFRLDGVFVQTEGMAVDGDGSLILVEDDPARVVWVDRAGRIVKELNGDLLDPPMTEPQGIARDPRNGHLLIVDDWEGSNSLFEFDAGGTLLGTYPLIAYGRDPEGIAIRPGANLVFMAFDGGARIVAFDYTPTVGLGGELPKPGADCMISGLRIARKLL